VQASVRKSLFLNDVKRTTKRETKKLKTFAEMTATYFATRHADVPESAVPYCSYVEYDTNGAPGAMSKSSSESQTRSIIREVAAAKASETKVRWLHFEGINTPTLDMLCEELKLAPPKIEGSETTQRLVMMRHRDPALRFFGTHAFLTMQLLDREDCEGDIPLVTDDQVSFIYVPEMRLIVSVTEDRDIESDFTNLQSLLVNGSSVCNKNGAHPAMLLALLADKFVDDAFPLAEELGDFLEVLSHAMVSREGIAYNQPVDKTRMQLWRMRRFSIRVKRLCETYEEDALNLFGDDAFQTYIEAVEKQSENLEHVCDMYITRCLAILERVEVYQNQKTNDTLFILTIITVMMVPSQFLTGMWGMNFVNMPELGLSWGYWLFLALIPTFMIGIFVLLKMGGYLEDTPMDIDPVHYVKKRIAEFKARGKKDAEGGAPASPE